jgi:flagellar basal body P-ring formation protein FlgA
MTSNQFTGRILRLVLGATTLAAIALPAAALDLDRKPVLRPAVSVRAEVVTIADFFEGAGTVGTTPIFRAPDLGQTGTVSAAKVVQAAKTAGLFDADAGGLLDVAVTHEAREITQDDVQKLVADQAARQSPPGESGELQVVFDLPLDNKLADASSKAPARLASLNYAPATGRFEALLIVDTGTGTDRQRIKGTITEMVRTLTLTRPLNRGDVLAVEDLTFDKQPRRQVGNAHQPDGLQIVGLAAKRQLRPGQQLSIADFAQPLLVNRGDIVTLVYEVPGLVLTAHGQALDNGTKGETISVVNQQSKRVVHGVVIAGGRVQVMGGFQTAAANGSTLIPGRQQQ